MATVVLRASCAIATLCLVCAPALAQRDPGIRGGFQNTAGMLQYRGISVPPPPPIGPHPTKGGPITANELASFKEGVLRAGQLEATCVECAMVTEGTPVNKRGELDATFPQFTTNWNGLVARHNTDQRFGCHTRPTLGGSGGLLVPNPGPQAQFTLLPPPPTLRQPLITLNAALEVFRHVKLLTHVCPPACTATSSRADGDPHSQTGVANVFTYI